MKYTLLINCWENNGRFCKARDRSPYQFAGIVLSNHRTVKTARARIERLDWKYGSVQIVKRRDHWPTLGAEVHFDAEDIVH